MFKRDFDLSFSIAFFECRQRLDTKMKSLLKIQFPHQFRKGKVHSDNLFTFTVDPKIQKFNFELEFIGSLAFQKINFKHQFEFSCQKYSSLKRNIKGQNTAKADFILSMYTDFMVVKTDFKTIKTAFTKVKTDFTQLKTRFHGSRKTDFTELETDFMLSRQDFTLVKTYFML